MENWQIFEIANIEILPNIPGRSELRARWYATTEGLERFDRWLIEVISEKCGLIEIIEPHRTEKITNITDILILDKPPGAVGKIIADIVEGQIVKGYTRWEDLGAWNDLLLTLDLPILKDEPGGAVRVDLTGKIWDEDELLVNEIRNELKKEIETRRAGAIKEELKKESEIPDELKGPVEPALTDKQREKIEAQLKPYMDIIELWNKDHSGEEISDMGSHYGKPGSIRTMTSRERKKIEDEYGPEIAIYFIKKHKTR